MHRELTWPMLLSREQLRARWTRACSSAGASAPSVDTAWAAIASAYDEPHRRYHTLEHIGELLVLLDDLTQHEPSPAVEVAAWIHDVVYDPTRSDNEAASAAWGRERLPELGFPAETVARVGELVLTTASHQPEPSDRDASLLNDVDLAILAAAPERYIRYVADIRAEYRHVGDASWRQGRGAVVAGFLALPSIYGHELLRPWEARARGNLTTESEALSSRV